jgi:hypothetical protein
MKIERVELSKLAADPANVRKHNSKNLKAIEASLRRFGQQKPIVVDGDGIVRAGNGTLAAAQQLGWTHIDIVRTELKGADATAYAIADNRTAELAEWDEEALSQQLAAIQIEDEDLAESSGFDTAEIEKMVLADKEVVEDEVPEPPTDPTTKPGDLWILGKHRLLCGDSTRAEDVDRLMDGMKADLCFTSPPYALGKSVSLSGNRRMSQRENPYDDHEDTSKEWMSLMSGWFTSSRAAVSDAWVINVQPLAGNKRDLVRFIANNAENLVDIVTWDKGHAAPQMAAGVMSSRYEWMVVFALFLAWNGTERIHRTSAAEQ